MNIILTATFEANKVKYLKDAAASVLAQTDKDWLWQIVLDNPSRETDAYVMGELFYNGDEGCKGDRRIKVWRHNYAESKRKEIYRPAQIFNEHMERLVTWHPDANICWLSDDDLLRPQFLMLLGRTLSEGHQVAYCGYSVMDEIKGQWMPNCVVDPNLNFDKETGRDPLCVLDSGCILQTAQSFRILKSKYPEPVPTGWDTAHYCDGLYLRRLKEEFGIQGCGYNLFIKRRTKVSTHYRPR